jgi:catechol 2,3-dioxygenase-like lactoylglutathione lyase family enzyme
MDFIETLPPAPRWAGVNHLALVTPDMDATVRFYVGVLGMPLVATLMAGTMRHYFFEIAPHNTVAFFEVVGATTFIKGAGTPGPYPEQFDHLSFNVADEAALVALQARVRAAGSQITEIVDHGLFKSVYVTDPNGIALEASYWITDGTGQAFNPTDPVLFTDPNPVPAIAELADGALHVLPTTQLA